MKPELWVPGLHMVDGVGTVICLVKRHEQRGWWYVDYLSTEDREMGIGIAPSVCGYNPATFSSLSRRPSDEPEGARAVRVSTQIGADSLLGMLYTLSRGEWRPDDKRCQGVSHDYAARRLAPLSAEEEATEVAHSDPDRCGGCGMLCDLCECPDTPAAPAEEGCERAYADGSGTPYCSVAWAGGDRTVDPCGPCCARIDAMEAAKPDPSRCVHGWRLDSIDDGCPWCKGRLR